MARRRRKTRAAANLSEGLVERPQDGVGLIPGDHQRRGETDRVPAGAQEKKG